MSRLAEYLHAITVVRLCDGFEGGNVQKMAAALAEFRLRKRGRRKEYHYDGLVEELIRKHREAALDS